MPAVRADRAPPQPCQQQRMELCLQSHSVRAQTPTPPAWQEGAEGSHWVPGLHSHPLCTGGDLVLVVQNLWGNPNSHCLRWCCNPSLAKTLEPNQSWWLDLNNPPRIHIFLTISTLLSPCLSVHSYCYGRLAQPGTACAQIIVVTHWREGNHPEVCP